jgi:hypothetical protein
MPVPSFDEFSKAQESQPPPFDNWKPPSLTPGTPNSGAAERFATGLASAVNPIPGIKAIATDPRGLRHGIEHNVFEPQRSELQKAGEAWQGKGEGTGMGTLGRASEAFGHGLAGVLPLVGPAAAHAGEEIGSGNVAGGLGEATGLLSTLATPKLTEGAGRGLSRAAEPIAENALGIRAVDRKFGRTPGRAALEETSGVRPETVARQAEARTSELARARDASLAASPNQVSLRPARDVVENAITKAAAGNSQTGHLEPIREQLNEPRPGFQGTVSAINQPPLGALGPSGPLRISELQTPSSALAIRQRLGNDFTKFDLARPVSRESQGVGNQAYSALTNEIHRAVPESAPLDRRMSNLIPVKEAADARKLAPDTTGRVLMRVARPTGALIGAAEGARVGGLPGALVGLTIPELLSDPTAQMIAARSLNRAGKITRAPATGRILQTVQNVREANANQ